ncbi:hypothetical protein PACID_30460 [Acidipropionibacterium acidipropionici ATCC 4875]|uniref:LytR/CpsA/Psr regulator C-terminal domain-containing protein n=1 Tax=Acidipropionibacterium acidipropionici (strain ATCC 4875 / DSM 20272 / JCM 6432 / NBRC 12425 / NCIMB 8070 / 4) TaxID=1171373 RepID=K7SNP7_ACIA4|nr:LytR C-terminal domain-containing protein [Acidipropionibacterium acidipropionici]AFV90810.1 hypothetical protein PACID_30460 [Acidipropionibacterium acidipropionici ATCC 4875]ALN15043.1 hypothetical protein ASQ49_06920 [Acidipropionibacterium acidipropionici]APZ09206.1 hypothetical protein BWX38_08010 [Acidipropionibacterium acidipropionici]
MTQSARHYLKLVATPITLLVLLAIIVVGFWYGWKALTAPFGPKAVPCVNTNVGKSLTTKSIELDVVNGGHTRGLAKQVANQLTAKGFSVTDTGNTDERVKQTVIVGVAKDSPEVKLVSAFFPKSTVRVDTTRVDHSVTVMVGENYGGFNAKAPTSLAVSGPVCLPSPSATPSPSGSATPAS